MALTHVPTRNEVDPRHTWNDTSVFASAGEWAEELDALNAEVTRVAAGGDPVLFKPVQPRRLFEILKSVLG